jgi:transcriptional regulator GlxA family with amidase domain
MIHFGIVLFDGFDELDAIAPWEVLRGAAALGAPFETTLFTLGAQGSVEASHGLRVVAGSGPPARPLDWLIVPGGGWADRSGAGAWAEIQRGQLPEVLRGLRGRGVSMASVCTGAMILSAAGITRGRSVTTHAIAKQALRGEGAEVIDARVVDDGDLITAGGVTSGIDLALWLTERLATSSIARAAATNLEYQRTGHVHRGPRA